MYQLNYFNFKNINSKYLLSNDLGNFTCLKKDDLEKMVNREILNKKIHEELLLKGFIYENKVKFLEDYTINLRNNKNYLFQRTQLHIFVLTNKCNLNCIYCQASSKRTNNKLMNKTNALKFVEIALSSKTEELNFEFQGGEPTLNFDIIKDIIEHTEKNKGNKIVNYNLVTNLYKISDDQINYLINNNVEICTSLDGNEKIHDFNRPSFNKDTFNSLEKNIKKINKILAQKNKKIQAIQTTSKKSLDYPEEIINSFKELGLKGIFLRPLTPLGKSQIEWKKVGYNPEEFLEFYKKSLYFILDLNKVGDNFIEHHTLLFLKRIFQSEKLNYMELRSPCGAGIGQIAYNYDGDIYTCDEGRMLKEKGDKSFNIGSVNNNLEKMVESPISKSILSASCLETIPGCSSCVYSPYCGVCPVYNYIEQGTIFSNPHESYKCKISKGILDIIFNILLEKSWRSQILYNWIGITFNQKIGGENEKNKFTNNY